MYIYLLYMQPYLMDKSSENTQKGEKDGTSYEQKTGAHVDKCNKL